MFWNAIGSLYSLHRKVDKLMVDLSKLSAAVDRLVADVEMVIPLVSDPTAAAQLQASVDHFAAALDAESVKVEALKAAAPTGATGP